MIEMLVKVEETTLFFLFFPSYLIGRLRTVVLSGAVWTPRGHQQCLEMVFGCYNLWGGLSWHHLGRGQRCC